VNGVINSESEYRLFGKPIFRWGDSVAGLYRNFSAGDSAGFSNNLGFLNTFVGGGAGILTTNGSYNCFIGSKTGYKNISGGDNTFIGSLAGFNSNGQLNTFVGSSAGFSNEGGGNNTIVGALAGYDNTAGIRNTIVGMTAGLQNETGSDNVFIGMSAGDGNRTGNSNTILGAYADLGSDALTNASAIGKFAYVTQSNSLVLGSINGINGGTADTRVGIGTTAPTEKLEIVGNIKVRGEVNHLSTGTTNLIPISFGSINAAGAINSGSGNFTVTRTAAGSYTINIVNHTYTFAGYSTTVTPGAAVPLVPTTDSFGGNLLVRIHNLSGVLTDGPFHFVIHRQ